MKTLLLTFLLFLPLMAVKAQYFFDFENQSLTQWTMSAPEVWIVSEQNPLAGQASLAHSYDNSSAGNDQISKLIQSTAFTGEVRWSFLLKYAYDPSGSNHWALFPLADTTAAAMYTGGQVNGFAIGVNLSGTADDVLKFWKYTNGTPSALIISTFNWQTAVGKSKAAALCVSRSASGVWEMFIDTTASGVNWQSLGTATDIWLPARRHTGLFYKYTASADQLLWMDNLAIADAPTPPVLLSMNRGKDNKITLGFSKRMESSAAQNIANYLTDSNEAGLTVVNASLQPDGTTVILTLSSEAAGNYVLNISNLKDLDGNTLQALKQSFSITRPPLPAEIAINEIMADPLPAVGLPDYEYIELHNTLPFDVNLENWTLTVGASVKTFGRTILPAHGYLIVCQTDVVSMFTQYGPVVGLLSASSLTNSGLKLSLSDDMGTVISEVTYSDTWYADTEKTAGGWSLERIDPTNTCLQAANWRASQHISGGTPGTVNSVAAPNSDQNPPMILNITTPTDSTLLVCLNEEIRADLLTDNENFSISSMSSGVLSAVPESGNTCVRLHLPVKLTSTATYTLTMSQAVDLCGNTAEALSGAFTYYVAQTGDVLVNEIMADPQPMVSLPDAEYIEIVNRSNWPVDLSGWQLGVNAAKTALNNATLAPGEFLLLCDQDVAANFEACEDHIMALADFPSITNTGSLIALYDNTGKTISAVHFNDSWYDSDYKQQGGWSLERIDTENLCGENENWTASQSTSGGTPCSLNSVAGSMPDTRAPRALRTFPLTDSTLCVVFDEALHPQSFIHLNPYRLVPPGLTPDSIQPVGMLNKMACLKFPFAFDSSVIYRLEINTITDCVNNAADSASLRFALPHTADSFAVVLNELLFNPATGGSDYVELYNRGTKVLNLADLMLARRDTASGELFEAYPASYQGFLLFPGDYVALTPDSAQVAADYHSTNPDAIKSVRSLPSLPDEEGNLMIINKIFEIIDEVNYTENWHFALLRSTDGVSLERMDYDHPTQLASNWHSAASTVLYGTPGYQNSQFRAITPGEHTIEISPDYFSPDNDGYEDLLTITYTLPEAGQAAHVMIFDTKGRKIKYLVNNDLPASEGFWIWDGTNENGNIQPAGIYIVYVELVNLEGRVQIIKKPCVLARLND